MTIAAVVLAAGEGTRLRPLTLLRPKPLCPVGNVPLVDLAIARATSVTGDVAVNVSAGREQMKQHLGSRVHLSIESPRPAGTAGALVRLREWIDGRDVLVVNADAWYPGSLAGLAANSGDGRIRLLTVEDRLRPDFGSARYAGAALIPWPDIAALDESAFGLYESLWKPAVAENRVAFVAADAPFLDCGTIADYHAANMAVSRGENVVGEGAVVEGEIIRTVLWPGVTVRRGERLENAVRARDDVTVVTSLR